MNDSRKRKKSESSNAERSKRKANRVGKKGDDEIISSFVEMMERTETMKNTPAYFLALGQFLCCAARDMKSIQTLERLLDSANLSETDSPSQCFVVEGVIRVCVSILNIALTVRSYDVALKVSNVMCKLLSLPVREEEDGTSKTYSSPLKVRFTMNDKERFRIRNASKNSQTWDQERLLDMAITSTHARHVLDTNLFATNILKSSEKLVQEYLRSRTKARSKIAELASKLLHILRFVRLGGQNQQRLTLLHVDEDENESSNTDVRGVRARSARI